MCLLETLEKRPYVVFSRLMRAEMKYFKYCMKIAGVYFHIFYVSRNLMDVEKDVEQTSVLPHQCLTSELWFRRYVNTRRTFCLF